MTAVSVQVNDERLQAMLDRVIAAAESPAEALDAIGFAFTQRIALGFNDQKDPWGEPWTPLSEATKAMRRKGPRPNEDRILRDTGALGNGSTYEVSGGELKIGTAPSTIDYAALQQFGYAKNKMFNKYDAPVPRRAFYPIDAEGNSDLPDSWLEEALDILDTHIEDAVR